jgi:hypothetical protein
MKVRTVILVVGYLLVFEAVCLWQIAEEELAAERVMRKAVEVELGTARTALSAERLRSDLRCGPLVAGSAKKP